MSFGTFAVMVVVGLLVGWLASYLLERGGYGLRWDMVLGLAGSAVGSWFLAALGVAPAAGLAAVTAVACAGAAVLIVAQRRIYPAIP